MILVKAFRKGLGRFSNGIVEILYWDMILFCDVIIFKNRKGVYIKIPQRCDYPNGNKINILNWRNKSVSDSFQEEVKKQLQENFPEALTIPELEQVKKRAKEIKGLQAKVVRDKPSKPKAKVFVDPPPLKARSGSRFHKKTGK